jgi:two-component system response regulator AlgR
MRALLVDDEPQAIERLQILCARVAGLTLAGVASDGQGAIRMAEALNPDLVLLGIAKSDFDGMAVAHALELRVPKPALVFVSAHDQFAVAAFDVSAVDYLLKPVTQERLERAVERARAKLAETGSGGQSVAPPTAPIFVQELWVRNRDEIIRIAVSDIDLIEAERDYIRLHVGKRNFLLHRTISELERRLDPAFFVRLHRSTIVRRDCITGFSHYGSGGWVASLRDGRHVRISRTHLAGVRGMAQD